MDDNVMPMSQEKRSRERERILAAALSVFAEKRYAGTTMALIAKHARMTEAATAKHFASKDALFAEVLAPAGLELVTPSMMRSFIATFELPWDDVATPLRTFFAHHVEFVRTNRQKVKPILREAMLRPETFLRALARRQGLYPRFVELVDDLKRRGEIRRDLPPLTVLFMVLSIAWGYGFARSVLMPDAEWDDAEQAWLFASVLAEGFRRTGTRKRVARRESKSRTTKGAKKRSGGHAQRRNTTPVPKKASTRKASTVKKPSRDSDRASRTRP